MDSLSAELLHQICSYLEPESVVGLRLANRRLADVGLQHLIPHVNVFLHRESFDRLGSIAAHPVLSRHVRSLALVPLGLPPVRDEDDFRTQVQRSQMARRRTIRSRRAAGGALDPPTEPELAAMWDRYVRVEYLAAEILEVEEYRLRFAGALRAFRRLETLAYGEYHRLAARFDICEDCFYSFYGLEPIHLDDDLRMAAFLASMWTEVSRHGIRIDEMIVGFPDLEETMYGDSFPAFVAASAASATSPKTLSLTISQGYPSNLHWEQMNSEEEYRGRLKERAGALFESVRDSLRSLELRVEPVQDAFSNGGISTDFQRLFLRPLAARSPAPSERHGFPFLRSVTLDQLWLHGPDLVAFLRARADTLRFLRLRNISCCYIVSALDGDDLAGAAAAEKEKEEEEEEEGRRSRRLPDDYDEDIPALAMLWRIAVFLEERRKTTKGPELELELEGRFYDSIYDACDMDSVPARSGGSSNSNYHPAVGELLAAVLCGRWAFDDATALSGVHHDGAAAAAREKMTAAEVAETALMAALARAPEREIWLQVAAMVYQYDILTSLPVLDYAPGGLVLFSFVGFRACVEYTHIDYHGT